MLDGIAHAYAVAVPGEPVPIPGGSGHRLVYPWGVVHVVRYPAEVAAVLEAAEAAEQVAGAADAAADDVSLVGAVLADLAFPLLSACCTPPLSGPTDPGVPAAAEAWARQSLLEHRPPSDEDADDADEPEEDDPGPPLPFAAVLAQLSAAGHSADEVFRRRQLGVTGEPLPYAGWTLPQLQYRLRGVRRATGLAQARAVDAVAVAIGGTFGGDRGSRSMERYVGQMRDEDHG